MLCNDPYLLIDNRPDVLEIDKDSKYIEDKLKIRYKRLEFYGYNGNPLSGFDFNGFEHVVYLDIGDLKLDHLPESILVLSKLNSLNIGNNNLIELPVWLNKFKNLKNLDCSNNRICTLSDDFFNLRSLIKLDISSNPLFILSDKIKRLNKLKFLDISGTELLKYPVVPKDCVVKYEFTNITTDINQSVNMITNSLNLMGINDE